MQLAYAARVASISFVLDQRDNRTDEKMTTYTESNHGWFLISSKVGRRDGSFSSICHIVNLNIGTY